MTTDLRRTLLAIADWLGDYPEVTPLGFDGRALHLHPADFDRLFVETNHAREPQPGGGELLTGSRDGLYFVAVRIPAPYRPRVGDWIVGSDGRRHQIDRIADFGRRVVCLDGWKDAVSAIRPTDRPVEFVTFQASAEVG
jgi:hypothetical protein